MKIAKAGDSLKPTSSPPIRRAGSQRLSVEGIAVETFRTEIQVRGNEFFGLAQKKISARLQVKMQALDQCDALGTGKVWQDVHAENAIEATDIAGAG